MQIKLYRIRYDAITLLDFMFKRRRIPTIMQFLLEIYRYRLLNANMKEFCLNYWVLKVSRNFHF